METRAPFSLLLAAPALLFSSTLTFAAEVPQQHLRPMDIEDSDDRDYSRFGADVQVQGNLVVIAAPAVFAAYIYALQGDTWQRVAKITLDNGENVDFGRYVALDGNYIAVSATGFDVNGIPDAGAVHVFERGGDVSEWVYRGLVVASNPTTNAAFGTYIVIDDQRFVTSAGGASGSAYLFERDNESGDWNETLRSPGSWTYPPRRRNVDLSGDTLTHASSPAVLDIFERDDSGWTFREQINLEFQLHPFALEDDVLAVGSPYAKAGELERGDEGRVEVHERGSARWNHVSSIESPHPAPLYEFGNNVELQDGILAASEKPEYGDIYIFAQDEAGEWAHLGTPAQIWTRDDEPIFSVSATHLAMAHVNSPATVTMYDIRGLISEGTTGDDDTGNDTDDGDDAGGDNGDDTGDGDDPETVTGDDEGAGEGDDDSGGGGGDETGSGGGASEDDPPETGGGGGGGALGWLLALMLSIGGARCRNESGNGRR